MLFDTIWTVKTVENKKTAMTRNTAFVVPNAGVDIARRNTLVCHVLTAAILIIQYTPPYGIRIIKRRHWRLD